jgi:hypothetical protein
VTICSRCGKENQDHYKFCLGCGAELIAPDASTAPQQGPAPMGPMEPKEPPTPLAPLPPMPPTGPQPRQPATADARPKPVLPTPTPAPSPDLPTAPPASEEPSAGLTCENCGTVSPSSFTFCGNCGTRLSKEPKSTMKRAAGAATAAKPAAVARLALIRPDGSEGGTHELHDPETLLGRGTGPLFESDSYLSPKHLRIIVDREGVVLEDAGSLNGVFIRIVSDEPLQSGEVFRIGQELLRFDAIGAPETLDDGTELLGSPNPGYWGRLSLIVSRRADGSAFPLMGDEMVLGREQGDILFSDDGYVSGTHAKISISEQGVFLSDLGSSNGTFVRIGTPREVPFGTFILMGQQLFRIDRV